MPAALLATTALVTPVLAADVTWIHDGATDDWFDGTNWDGGLVPGAGDNVINDDATAMVIDSGDATIKDLTIGDGLLIVNNHTLTSTGDTIIGSTNGLVVPATIQVPTATARFDTGNIVIGQEGNYGRLLVSAGTINADDITVGEDNSRAQVDVYTGGTLNSGDVVVGAPSTIDAIVTINGVGSVWDAGTYDVVNGLVEIEDGGHLITQSASISGPTGTPTVSLADNDTLWQITGNLSVGGKVMLDQDQITVVTGSGELDINNAGSSQVNVDGSALIGVGIGSTGIVDLSGAGNKFTVDGGSVGIGLGGGEGTLYVSDHSTADFSGAAFTLVGSALPTSAELSAGGNGKLLVKASDIDTQNVLIGIGGTGEARLQSTSHWDADGVVVVGGLEDFGTSGGTGTLRIEDDSVLNSRGGLIGSNGGTGTVNVVDSRWNDDGGLAIGGHLSLADDTLTLTSGTGKLTVTGGVVQSGPDELVGGLQIGVGQGSIGTVEVLGANSTFGTTGDLAFIGAYGGTGSIKADGLNASVLLGGYMQIVGGGIPLTDIPEAEGPSTGSIEITNGAVLANESTLGVGIGATGTGSVTLSKHSQWFGDATVIGALEGTGSLDISGGSEASLQSTVGIGAGGTGTATVSGIDPVSNDASLLSTQGSLAVGGTFSIDQASGQYSIQGGVGTLTVSDGARLESAEDDTLFPSIGVGNGAVGKIAVTGAGSSWDMTGPDMFVGGFGGSGTVSFADNATGSIAATTFVGGLPFTVDVEDGDQHATGTFEVSSGATVDTGALLIGSGNGTGKLDISGAGTVLTVHSLIYGGLLGGDGHVTVSQGALLESEDAFLGSNDGTVSVAVTGGSNWDISGSLLLGGYLLDDDPADGQGEVSTFVVSSGSAVTSTGNDIGVSLGNGDLLIDAIGLDGNGKMTVTGAGSRWTSTADAIFIGLVGAGELDAVDHASVETGGLIVSANAGNTSLKVTGGASLVNNISALGYSAVGGFDGSLAEAEISGSGSHWVDHGGLFVGSLGFQNGNDVIFYGTNGSLTIADGASVTSEGFAAPNGTTDIVGRSAYNTSNGSVLITGANSTWTSTADVLGIGVEALGTGIVTIADNGSLAVKDLAIGIDGGNGTIAPDTTATVTVGGDLEQGAGSIYTIAIDPTTNGVSSFISVAGTASIEDGAEVALLPVDSLPALGNRYTILTAAGGVDGTYTADASLDTAFLGLELDYDPNNVYLDVIQTRTFEDVALTPNQKATAQGLESLPVDNPLYQAILGQQTQHAARDAFDLLSGDSIASINGMLLQDGSLFRDQILTHLQSASGSVFAPQIAPAPLAYVDNSTPATNAIGSAVVAPSEQASQLALWGNMFGSWRHTDSDGNAARIEDTTGGMVVGLDGAVNDTTRLGAVIGYTHSGFAVDDRDSIGDSANYHIGVYAGTGMGAFALRGGLAYTHSDVDTTRTVTFPGFTDVLTGDYSASTIQAFGEVAYDFDMGAVSFEPFGNLAIVNQHSDAFTEDGGAAALHVGSTDQTTTFTTIGLRATANLDMGGTPATLKGTLGWRHAFGDTTPDTDVSFAGGDAFSIGGAPIARDSAVVEAGLDLNLSPTTTLGFSYAGQLSDQGSDQSVKAAFSLKF